MALPQAAPAFAVLLRGAAADLVVTV